MWDDWRWQSHLAPIFFFSHSHSLRYLLPFVVHSLFLSCRPTQCKRGVIYLPKVQTGRSVQPCQVDSTSSADSGAAKITRCTAATLFSAQPHFFFLFPLRFLNNFLLIGPHTLGAKRLTMSFMLSLLLLSRAKAKEIERKQKLRELLGQWAVTGYDYTSFYRQSDSISLASLAGDSVARGPLSPPPTRNSFFFLLDILLTVSFLGFKYEQRKSSDRFYFM